MSARTSGRNALKTMVFSVAKLCKAFLVEKLVFYLVAALLGTLKFAPYFRQRHILFTISTNLQLLNRYSGKTQKQIIEFVRDNYVKRQTFQRFAINLTLLLRIFSFFAYVLSSFLDFFLFFIAHL